MSINQQQQGIFHRARVWLLGERVERLRESITGAHALSYLLVTVQSAAVVLALGHQQLQLVLSGDPAIVLIAALALFLLVASVVAADLCLLATLQRLPVLARNRQTWALLEHLAYLGFVLFVEGSTLALVLAVLDTDPRALVSAAPIIPAAGWLFAVMIAARAVLTCWTAVQLWIVRGKLPPQWSTLLLEARELLGGKAQQVMSGLNLDAAPLAALFDAYAQMSRPPTRMARWWNKGLIAREAVALAREDEQREAVVRALSSFDVAHTPLASIAARVVAVAPDRPPTGPGSPTAAPVRTPTMPRREAVIHLVDPDTPTRRRPPAARRSNTRASRRVRTPTDPDAAEAAARAVWQPGMSVTELQRAADISRNAASKHRRILMAEAESGATLEGVAQ
jgi:hypothetical protein